MTSNLTNFLKEENAATSVEYAIMLMLILMACIAAIQFFGAEASNTMTSNSQEIATAINP